MDWTMLIGVASIIVTNLITIITLYIHLDNKTEHRLAKMTDLMQLWTEKSDNLIREMKNEMSDFHGRMCKLEERNKVKGEKSS